MKLSDALTQIFESEKLLSFPTDLGIVNSEIIPEKVYRDAIFCGFDEPDAKRISAVAEKAATDDALKTVIGAVAATVFSADFRCRMNGPWVTFEKYLGENAGAANIIAALTMVDIVKKMHSVNGVPESVTRDTCHQIRDYSDNFVRGKGTIGLYPGQFGWLVNYINPSLLYLRFTRLEFMTKPNYLKNRVYRNRRDSSVAVFAQAGINFDAAGFALGNAEDEPGTDFRSTFELNNGIATGNLVDENGRTSKKTTSIDTRDCDTILEEGIPVLDMHIPSGGGMSPRLVAESFARAKAFYGNLPDVSRRPKAVVCHSWIFNPNLNEILPPESNLLSLQKRVRLLPTSSGTTDGLWFVFLNDGAFDPDKVQTVTSMQKSIVSYIKRGGRWRVGTMFMLID